MLAQVAAAPFEPSAEGEGASTFSRRASRVTMATRLLPPPGEEAPSHDGTHSTAAAYDCPPSPPLSPPLLTSSSPQDEDDAEDVGHTPLVFSDVAARGGGRGGEGRGGGDGSGGEGGRGGGEGGGDGESEGDGGRINSARLAAVLAPGSGSSSGSGGGGGGGGCAMPYCEQKHLCVQLRSWRTRISLLLLYMVLSMVAAMAATLSFLSPAGGSESGIMLEVRLIDCVLLYSHGPFLAVLFGFAPELTEPLFRGGRWLYRKLYARTSPTQPVRRMPRTFSGIW